MRNLPIEFVSNVVASGDFSRPWVINSSGKDALCSVPQEFGGEGGGFSPEDLFLQAIMNCFAGTFKVYANASRITFSNLTIKGRLIVDKNEVGQITMDKCFLEIGLSGVEKEERVRTLVAKALKEGFILNSVKTEIQTTLTFNRATDEKSF